MSLTEVHVRFDPATLAIEHTSINGNRTTYGADGPNLSDYPTWPAAAVAALPTKAERDYARFVNYGTLAPGWFVVTLDMHDYRQALSQQ